MKKTFMSIVLTASLGLGGLFGEITPAKADSNIESKISNLQEELKQSSKQLEELTTTINETQEEMQEKNKAIAETKTNIEDLQNEIVVIEERIEARSVVLKERAVSLQESGGPISYIEVLLGAQSFSDFINRTEAVATIVSADKGILEEHQKDIDRVNEAKVELETELTSLETKVAELKRVEEESNDKMKELEEKEKEIQSEVNKLQAELDAQAQAAQALQQTVQASTDSSTNSSVSVKGNGTFGWPAVGGVITSYQGPRWGKLHKGIDIAGVSDRSILAADGGTVIVAGWSDSYGNMVKIDHGNGYTTLYAHMSSLTVSSGQSVSKGQKIGVMGSTGNSTGMHLHFEVFKNGGLVNPMSVL